MTYRVLVVEDEVDTLHLLAVKLRKEGHNVSYARTGSEALPVGVENAPDVVVLDILLPDANGLDLIGDLKRLPSKPLLLVLSGKHDDDTIRTAFARGADDFVPKPFSPTALAQRIQIALLRAGREPRSVEAS